MFITPRETRRDAYRVCRLPEAAEIARRAGVTVERQYSFPFPRVAGKVFSYNEFVLVGHVPE